MSASQVLKPPRPTYYTTLAPNDALPDPNFCNQCKQWNLLALNLLLKFHTTRGCRIRPICRKHTWSVMRQRRKTP